MAKASYSYTAIELPPSPVHRTGTIAYRPLVVATLTASNGFSSRCLVLPDSGADACLFPLMLAIALQLDVSTLPKTMTGGVGSQSNVTYYDTVTIDLGDGIEFSAYVGFTQGMDSVGLGLLGQAGFFEQYNVEFRHNQKVFAIESA